MTGRILASVSVAAALVTSLMLSGAGPASADRSAVPAEAHRYCHVLVSSDRDVHGDSKVLASACSSVSSAVARREFEALRVKTPDGRQVRVAEVAASSTLIMSWFQSYDGNGPFGNSTAIYGNSGTCDTSGYGVAPNAYWAANLSYIIGAGYCNRIRVEDRSRNNRSSVYSNRVGLAPPFNDNVGRVQVFWSGGS